MNLPSVSVVIPVYNRAKLIGRALESVFTQSFQDFEVIIVDDASTDDLGTALKPFDDPRMQIVTHEKNRGAGAARNTGIRASRGKYIAFLDSDDEWTRRKLARQVAYLETAPDTTPLACTGFFMDHSTDQKVYATKLAETTFDLDMISQGSHTCLATTLMIRRSCFDEMSLYDEGLPCLEVWDLLLRFARRWSIGVIGEPMAWIHFYKSPPTETMGRAIEHFQENHREYLRTHNRHAATYLEAAITKERLEIFYRNQQFKDSLKLAFSLLLKSPWLSLATIKKTTGAILHYILFRHKKKTLATFDKEPKILHVISSLQTGGAEGMLTSLLLHSKGGQEHIQVAVLYPGGANLEKLLEAGYTVLSLGTKRIIYTPISLLRLIRIIRLEQPDIIHSWLYHADLISTLALYLSGRRIKTKLIWGIRCSDMNLSNYSPFLRLSVWLCRLLSTLPDMVTANSRAGRDFHIEMGYKPKRIELFENSYDLSLFTRSQKARKKIRQQLDIPEDAIVVIAVGRNDPMKSWPTFIEAFSASGEIFGIVAGSGTLDLPDLPNLRRLGRRNDVPDLLAASDIFVSSSAFGEGFSNAIAEAMASGLPVIATDVGDSAYIVQEGGIIVSPMNPGQISSAICSLAGDPDLRMSMGQYGRERIATRYNIEEASRKLLKFYDRSNVEVI